MKKEKEKRRKKKSRRRKTMEVKKVGKIWNEEEEAAKLKKETKKLVPQ